MGDVAGGGPGAAPHCVWAADVAECQLACFAVGGRVDRGNPYQQKLQRSQSGSWGRRCCAAFCVLARSARSSRVRVSGVLSHAWGNPPSRPESPEIGGCFRTRPGKPPQRIWSRSACQAPAARRQHLNNRARTLLSNKASPQAPVAGERSPKGQKGDHRDLGVTPRRSARSTRALTSARSWAGSARSSTPRSPRSRQPVSTSQYEKCCFAGILPT